MKYTIRKVGGDRVHANRPRVAKITDPTWATKFEFFTHEVSGGNSSAVEYAVSEVTTGYRLGECGGTRKGAIANAVARLKEKGYRRFSAARIKNAS